MKKINTLLIGLLATTFIQAQQQTAQLAISVTGNKNLVITVDDRNYSPESAHISGNKSMVLINDLSSGQHNLQISRTNLNTNRADRLSTMFILRSRYNMQVNVNEDGSLELIETLKGNLADEHTPMSNTNFAALLRSVKSQRTTAAKMTTTSNALNNPANYFTSYQVRQLVQLFVSENDRLQLLKLSYPKITDQSNFYQLYNLLRNAESTRELEEYVSGYYDYNDAETPAAMSDADFNTLYQSVRQQWSVSAQINSISDAFNNKSNYFTSYQASRLIQLVNGENNRLQLAKSSYRGIIDRENFSQVASLLSFQSSKDELANYVNTYTDETTTGIPMPEAEFNSLYQDIRNEWPLSAQVTALNNAFNNSENRFSSNQASRLIQLVTGDNNRLPLAKLSYRSITDRDNFNQVVSLLSTQAARNELTMYISNYGAGNTTRTPMPDAEFRAIYQDVQMQFLPGAKMSALTTIFNNNSYFFSTAQAKQLVSMVSLESNRLQLAKLSYRSITDRENFSQLYDVLGNQSSKDELDAYVRAYRD